jgi:hypothetical protein
MTYEVTAQIDTPWGMEWYVFNDAVDTLEEAE